LPSSLITDNHPKKILQKLKALSLALGLSAAAPGCMEIIPVQLWVMVPSNNHPEVPPHLQKMFAPWGSSFEICLNISILETANQKTMT
jgi:hypothetical protein